MRKEDCEEERRYQKASVQTFREINAEKERERERQRVIKSERKEGQTVIDAERGGNWPQAGDVQLLLLLMSGWDTTDRVSVLR